MALKYYQDNINKLANIVKKLKLSLNKYDIKQGNENC